MPHTIALNRIDITANRQPKLREKYFGLNLDNNDSFGHLEGYCSYSYE